MKFFLSLFIFFILVQLLISVTFNVSSVAGIQSALDNSSANGEDDTINIATGTYNIVTTLTFWSNEGHSLTINGENYPILNGNDSTTIFEFMTESANTALSINGLIIEDGHANNGGAVYLETQSAAISVTDCIIRDNTTDYICGGVNIYAQTATINVTDCTFLRNSSPNTMGYPYGTAGGLFVQTEGGNAHINLSGSTFENNTAHRDAAGAMLYPMGINTTVRVENNIFSNNISEEFGGGCWIRCPAGGSTVEYHNNILSNNSAASQGSGGGTYIEMESGTINMTDNIHTGNSAAWQGGALFINHSGGTINMQNNRFSENTSLQAGGAANIYLEDGIVAMDHNVFDENESLESGGGLCLSTTRATFNIFNNTFYSNTANDGGDVYFYFDDSSSSLNFYNNILYGSSMPGFSYSGAITATATYSDIDGGTGEPWFATGCIDANPLFQNTANGDFHITWANFPISDGTKSSCIDAGDPSSILDIDGSIADIGAFYFNQTLLIAPTNIIISIVDSNITLNWDPVNGANSYNIYSSSNPYSGFTLQVTDVSATTWSESIGINERKFYYVTAKN